LWDCEKKYKRLKNKAEETYDWVIDFDELTNYFIFYFNKKILKLIHNQPIKKKSKNQLKIIIIKKQKSPFLHERGWAY
jgi:hypothetical protein